MKYRMRLLLTGLLGWVLLELTYPAMLLLIGLSLNCMDRYFRGWDGVKLAIGVSVLLGATIGLFYSVVLLVILLMARRTLPLWSHLKVMLCAGLIVFGASVLLDFWVGEVIGPWWLPQVIIACACLSLAVIQSRREKAEPETQQGEFPLAGQVFRRRHYE